MAIARTAPGIRRQASGDAKLQLNSKAKRFRAGNGLSVISQKMVGGCSSLFYSPGAAVPARWV